MDRIIYTAMNGAARIAEHQTVLGNNMANVNTPGFREQIALYRSVPMADGTSLPPGSRPWRPRPATTSRWAT